MATKTHKDICVQFTLAGRNFEAIGFLNKDEPSTDGDEMLKRTNGDGDVANEDDWKFICEHKREFPTELQKYILVTNRREPGGPRRVSYLHWSGYVWYEYWRWLDDQWNGHCLVVRRRT